jgi:deoxycytidine triphosphate deaminase
VFLSDTRIRALLEAKKIGIDPFIKENLGPNSYDLTLHHHYRVYDKEQRTAHDISDGPLKSYEMKPDIDRGYIFIPPFTNAIIMTNEIITINSRSILGWLSARSNLSLILNFQFSQLVDTGYSGRLCAQVYNPFNTIMAIQFGTRFMQILFAEATEVGTKYLDRACSKNIKQYTDDVPQYKVDKEFRKASE